MNQSKIVQRLVFMLSAIPCQNCRLWSIELDSVLLFDSLDLGRVWILWRPGMLYGGCIVQDQEHIWLCCVLAMLTCPWPWSWNSNLATAAYWRFHRIWQHTAMTCPSYTMKSSHLATKHLCMYPRCFRELPFFLLLVKGISPFFFEKNTSDKR